MTRTCSWIRKHIACTCSYDDERQLWRPFLETFLMAEALYFCILSDILDLGTEKLYLKLAALALSVEDLDFLFTSSIMTLLINILKHWSTEVAQENNLSAASNRLDYLTICFAHLSEMLRKNHLWRASSTKSLAFVRAIEDLSLLIIFVLDSLPYGRGYLR